MQGLFAYAVANKELCSYEERVEYYNQFYVVWRASNRTTNETLVV